jgi:hypothetical protein
MFAPMTAAWSCGDLIDAAMTSPHCASACGVTLFDLKVSGAADVPVRRQHRECVAGHPDGHVVLAGEIGGREDVGSLVVAGLVAVT